MGGRCEIGLRCVLPLLLFGSSLMTDGWAQHKSTVKRTSSAISMKSASEGAISVSFVSAPDGAALTGVVTAPVPATGTVSFADGATVLGTAAVSGGTATRAVPRGVG